MRKPAELYAHAEWVHSEIECLLKCMMNKFTLKWECLLKCMLNKFTLKWVCLLKCMQNKFTLTLEFLLNCMLNKFTLKWECLLNCMLNKTKKNVILNTLLKYCMDRNLLNNELENSSYKIQIRYNNYSDRIFFKIIFEYLFYSKQITSALKKT